MKKGQKQLAAVLIVIVLVAGFFIVVQMGYTAQFGLPPFQAQPNNNGNNGNNNNNPTTDYSKGIGKYQLDFKAANSITQAALAFGTDLDIWAMHYTGGQYTSEGPVYDPTKTNYFTATAQDNGLMYLLIKPHSTTYYVDYQTILSRNPAYVSAANYVTDPLGDGHRDFMFTFNLKNQPLPNAGMYPVLGFTAFGLAYDSSFPALTGLGNQSSIGAVAVPKYFELDFTFSAADLGVGFYKLDLYIGNSTKSVTDQTKVTITSVDFPGVGRIDGTTWAQNQYFTTQDIRYTYNIASSLYGADYQSLGPTANNKFPIQMQLQFNLAAYDEIPITFIVYYFNNAGVGQSKTTTFYANA